MKKVFSLLGFLLLLTVISPAQSLTGNCNQQSTRYCKDTQTISNIGGGQDGATLVITDTKGYAHTVTTGANGINGSKHIATFSAALGSSFTLRAYNGSWWMQTGTGVTLS